MERYYQIARCYRDEDFRADRQPEFTQLDMEMSFVDADDVIAVSEEILTALWALIGYDLPLPLPRISYADAMRRFGSDKPDLRFGLELVECTEYFSDTTFRVFQAPYVGAVVMPGGASQPRRTLDGWQEFAKQRGHKGLAYVLVAEDGTLGGPVAKNLTDAERDGLAAHVGAKPGDCIFFSAGSAKAGARAAGRHPHRDRQAARHDRPRRRGRSPGWWTGRCSRPPTRPPPPATSPSGRVRGPPCTTRSPRPSRSPRPRSTPIPGSALANAYDIVCNGNEIGGGSIRIHRRDVQERVFAMMGIDHDEAQDKFGFLLDAFTFGAPPHGGIAFGWDRITALLAGADSIREVIAFPKSGGGVDPLTDAPAPITAQQRKESGIDAKPEEGPDRVHDARNRRRDASSRHDRSTDRTRRLQPRPSSTSSAPTAARSAVRSRAAPCCCCTPPGAKSGQAAAVAAGLSDDRRQDAHHRAPTPARRRIRPGCTTCGPTRVAHIEVGTDAYDVDVREVPPDERDAPYAEGRRGRADVRRLPGKTTRVIPLFELTRVE